MCWGGLCEVSVEQLNDFLEIKGGPNAKLKSKYELWRRGWARKIHEGEQLGQEKEYPV